MPNHKAPKATGRPRKYNRPELLEKLEAYIAATDIPIVAEFCAINNVSKSSLYEMSELSETIKKCTTKKEAALERGTLNGSLCVPMAIFSLKQLGWRDNKQDIAAEIKITGGLPD